jgi:hypothetical protein
MKSTELKSMIKAAVKEAIQDELKDILLEAVRSPKAPTMYEQQTTTSTPEASPMPKTDKKKLRENMMNVLGGMKPGQDSISMNSSHAQGFAAPAYNPGAGANTAGQGSALPPGDVNLNQIMGLINKK